MASTESWKLHSAVESGTVACCSPTWVQSHVRVSAWVFCGLPSHVASCGTGRTVLDCQQSKQWPWAQHLYTVSLGNSFSYGMVFWGPVMSPAVGETLLPLLHKGVTLKMQPSALKIDNAIGLDEGEQVAFLSPGNHLQFLCYWKARGFFEEAVRGEGIMYRWGSVAL